MLVWLVSRDSEVMQDHQAQLDHKGPSVLPVLEVSLACRVCQDLKEIQEHEATQVHKAHRVSLVHWASAVCKASPVCLARLDPKVLKVLKVRQVRQVPLEQLVSLDLKEQMASE